MMNFAKHKKISNLGKLFIVMAMACLLALAGGFCSLFGLGASQQAAAESSTFAYYVDNQIKYIDGDFLSSRVTDFDEGFEFLSSLKEHFGCEDVRDVFAADKVVSGVGGKVFKFDQLHCGVRVYGGQMSITTDSYGAVIDVSGNYETKVNFDSTINYSTDEAVAYASTELGLEGAEYQETIYVCSTQSAYLAYVIEGESGQRAFVSARTLKATRMLEASFGVDKTKLPDSSVQSSLVDTEQTNYFEESVQLAVEKYVERDIFGRENTYYILGDKDRNIYISTGANRAGNDYSSKAGYWHEFYYSTDGVFDDPVAVQAYEFIMKCYDFYEDVSNFGVSISGLKNARGNDVLLIGIVHYERDYENAAYHLPSSNAQTAYFLFGDGNPLYGTGTFVQALDVVGHEYQHAISESVVELDPLNEAGAINESVSDIFGAAIESYYQGNDIASKEFWQMGEDLFTTSGYFRDMSAPYLNGDTSSYANLAPLCTRKNCNHETCDNGNVHKNSTLLTYATYLMYKQDPEFFTTNVILSLWYKTLTKLTSTSTFVDFAIKMNRAAVELGFTQTQLGYVQTAFASVGIPGFESSEVWGGYSKRIFQGSGTISDPYIIASVQELATMASFVNTNQDDGAYRTGRYTLAADIDLKDVAWEPIGTATYPFSGTFNGGNHTISGLNLNNSARIYNGFFGYTGPDAYIYNLNIGAGSTTSTAAYTGAIAGLLAGAISSCRVDLSITGLSVGGLAGEVQNTAGGQVITSSYTTGCYTGDVVGGLAARFSTFQDPQTGAFISGYVSGCYTTARLVGGLVGGLVGEANGVIIINCLVAAQLVQSEPGGLVGGVVGTLQYKTFTSAEGTGVANYIISCYQASSIEAENSANVGLMFAKNMGSSEDGQTLIENCTAKGSSLAVYVESSCSVTEKEVAKSDDAIYQGAFDFDNKDFYTTSRFTYLEGAETFDLATTYRLDGEQKMPVFISSSFWLQHSKDFDLGDGSAANPYQISSAEQLAFLAAAINDPYLYENYATKNYILTSDIDLYGRLWTGIGFVRYLYDDEGGRSIEGAEVRTFRGTFDGNNHSILNMNSVAAMSSSPVSRTEYIISSYLPGLFGVTSAAPSAFYGQQTTIKNVTIEAPSLSGSIVGGVVAQVIDVATISNVSVSGGRISSSNIAGGIVGLVENSTMSIQPQNFSVDLLGCSVNTSITGRVAGGAIGYISFAADNMASAANVTNFLMQGKISVSGVDTTLENGRDYRATAGGVVGVTLAKNLTITNPVILADVVSYSANPLLGGFIGATGQMQGSNAFRRMVISITGGKFAGKCGYVFDDVFSSAGKLLGGAYTDSPTMIELNADSTTYVSIHGKAVFDDSCGALSVTDRSSVSASEAFEAGGDFDFYNDSYWQNNKYFASSKWSTEDVDRLYITVVFKDYDGTVLSTYRRRKKGDVLTDIPTPTRAATPQYTYEFAGWSDTIGPLDHSMTLYARYNEFLRSYEVTYKAENGAVIDVKETKYGYGIDQSVKAPEKKGNFFVRYSFIRWGEKDQVVKGAVTVTPVYKMRLTGAFLSVLAAVIIVTIIVVVFVWSRLNKSHYKTGQK